ncbi:Prolyl oligopeptidase family protein [Tenacibaculum sp. MAR_2009_124]|uniref:alpha/beta hydrolase family protein n=1 Tax=Tenacibaculum sp. MAR_2009_124 TaxID=1250059 RepID=UPI000899DED3|nr:prolyl oligopeptidase family serine peptidase [Tenacibaculum sp. MAR_2009_124]SEB45942.1 Prolyl oligopeptidase family protein [Tenacibaculum sp. MAR_2009_124]
MKYFKLSLLLVLTISNTVAQHNGLLLKKEKISTQKYLKHSKLTQETNGKRVWRDAYKKIDDVELYAIQYLSDSLKVNGFLMKPKTQGKYPCIIFNRGGNRDFSKVSGPLLLHLFASIVSKGYIVIASQYRGNGGSEGKEEFGGKDVNDVLILPDVLKEIEGADTDRIGIYGWSRGSMMTYIALTKTNKIKAAVVGGGQSDLTIMDRPKFEKGVYAELIPNYWENKTKELEKRSAIKWVDKFPKNVPILMLHGSSDWRVKAKHSLNLALQFEKYKIPYRLVVFEGGDHGLTGHSNEVNEQVLKWFNRYLKNNEKLPNVEYHGH